jgi:hypothetical protein
MINKTKLLHNMYILSILTVSLAGCGESPHVKDLSDIALDMRVTRFEQDLFSSTSVDEILKLSQKHPDFYPVYVNDIIAANVQRPGANDTDVAVELYKYISHRDMDSLYGIVQSDFKDFSLYQKGLEEASKYIAYYFPEDSIRNVTTFISTFQYGAVYDQVHTSFGVGLDMYLGSDFEVYGMLNPENFPLYRVRKFEPYRIVPNCIQTYADYKVPAHSDTKFIEKAVYEGKKLYLLDLLLPTAHDSLKINYTRGQIEWCVDQEENMWKYLVQEDILFSSDKNQYQKHYFNDGPFTTPFGNESAPRTGAWVGWQIVRKYMAANPSLTIHDLLAEKDHQAIFQKSGYRP